MPVFYGAIDLSQNELRNARVQNIPTAPSTPVTGQLWYDSTNQILKWWNGTTWVPAMSGGSLSPATTVTNEAIGVTPVVGTSANYAREDHRHGMTGPAVAALDMGGYVINNLATPASAGDAANKSYVDSLVNGLSWKAPVRAYGAANIPLTGIPASGLTDGVTLVDGDRILLNNQSTPSQNGIYVVASGAWSRATDNDNAAEMVNATVYISEGTTYADTQWTCVTNAPITIGTTTIQFQQIAGAGTYSWGQGLTNVGNTVNVNPGTGITIVADAVTVDSSVVALKSDIATMTKKYAAALAGNVAYATGEVVTHNLNTRDVQVIVINGASPYQAVEVDWEATSVNTVTLRYNPNTLTGYRVVVVG
jgi:hypothetical protein